MNPLDEKFAARMTELRKASGMSQTDLAEALTKRGLSFHQQTIGRIERGGRSVSIGEAVLIAEALGTDLASLMGPGRWASGATQIARIAELERAVAAAHRALGEVTS